MSLKTQLQDALAYCNTQLASKGVTDTATSVVDVGDKIATIQQGGGTGLNYQLIGEATLSTDQHTVRIDIDNQYANVTDVILDLSGVQLSADDWLYPRINSTSVSGTPYTNKASAFDRIKMGWYRLTNGAWYYYTSFATVGNSNDLSYVNVACYTASVNILSGSTIKVYGR